MAMPESMLFESRDGATTLMAMGDTIRMPWTAAAADDERVVRPALAVLFRIAVGPSADSYVPRFLRYERTGRSIPGWHWPAFFVPALWAFYRRLWLPGLLGALLPLAGVSALAAIAPAAGVEPVAWLALAVLFLWVVPGAISAVFANALLYRRVRRIVTAAEAAEGEPHDVATIVAASKPTSMPAAFLLGGAVMAAVFAFAVPWLHTLYDDLGVRKGLAESLAALRPLQQQIEDSVLRLNTIPPEPDIAAIRTHLGRALIDTVNLSQMNWRLRLVLGPALGELSGKMILLVPTEDARERVQWLCIPIDVLAKFLPPECRTR
jgi:hypothetical protein